MANNSELPQDRKQLRKEKKKKAVRTSDSDVGDCGKTICELRTSVVGRSHCTVSPLVAVHTAPTERVPLKRTLEDCRAEKEGAGERNMVK